FGLALAAICVRKRRVVIHQSGCTPYGGFGGHAIWRTCCAKRRTVGRALLECFFAGRHYRVLREAEKIKGSFRSPSLLFLIVLHCSWNELLNIGYAPCITRVRAQKLRSRISLRFCGSHTLPKSDGMLGI